MSRNTLHVIFWDRSSWSVCYGGGFPIVGELEEMLYQFEEPFLVDHSKFESSFGKIATPLDDAI